MSEPRVSIFPSVVTRLEQTEASLLELGMKFHSFVCRDARDAMRAAEAECAALLERVKALEAVADAATGWCDARSPSVKFASVRGRVLIAAVSVLAAERAEEEK